MVVAVGGEAVVVVILVQDVGCGAEDDPDEEGQEREGAD